MQPLDLNLASNPFRNNTLLWIGYGAGFVLLGLLTYWNVDTYVEHRRMLQELRNQVGTFESQRLDLETRAARAQAAVEQMDIEALRVQAAKANEVINWKAFSWTRLFNAMESVQPNQVRMTSIRPIFHGTERGGPDRPESGEPGMPVAIEGTARTFPDVTELEHALQSDPHFRRVEPERFTRSPTGEIVFQIRFNYSPDLEPASAAGSAASGEGAAEPEPPSGEGPRAPSGPETTAEVREAGPGAEPAGEAASAGASGGSR